jgi:hypothetical protein
MFPSPNFVNNVSLLMLIITLFTLAFCDGHVNDFYTEYQLHCTSAIESSNL